MILFEKTVNLNELKEAAYWFCQHLALGDVVCLKGDLGSGKSEFARACIQTLMGHPVDVPSPTFTLCQSYESPKGPVLHYDLFRLDQEEDAWELGIIEQIRGHMSFIEWPQLIEVSLKRHQRVFDVSLSIASQTQRNLRICHYERPRA